MRATTTDVLIEPMHRRHLRAVMRADAEVYPDPWSADLYRSELGQTDSRRYVVARIGRELVGYGGMMFGDGGGHVTTMVVTPGRQRRGIGTSLMLDLARAACARGVATMSLEVRVGNAAAQALYRRFGFAPAGVRKGYYKGDRAREDALVMWVHDVDAPEYEERLDEIETRRFG